MTHSCMMNSFHRLPDTGPALNRELETLRDLVGIYGPRVYEP